MCVSYKKITIYPCINIAFTNIFEFVTFLQQFTY